MMKGKVIKKINCRFPWWWSKNSPANAGDAENVGSIPGLRRPPGGGNGNPLQ